MQNKSYIYKVLAILILTLLITPLAISTVYSQPTKGPKLDTVIYYGVTTIDKGVKGVETGEYDAFMWEVLPGDLEMAGVDVTKVRLIPAIRYVDVLDINPYSDPDEKGICGLATRPKDGVVVFNPLALREVRFQLNNLINRKYISYELLRGGGEPAFTYVSLNHPAWRYIKDITEGLGLRDEGNEYVALQKIREAVTNASQCMARFNYTLTLETDPASGRKVWTLTRPDGSKEPVKIVFLIRIEDERKLIGDYIAGQLEKADFLVERKYIERAQYRPLVRSADPRNVEWNIYTHSDAMLRSLWIHEEVGYWYTATYGPLPTTGGRWEYTVEHAEAIGDTVQGIVEDISAKLYKGEVSDLEEYWSLIKEGTRLAVYQSLRVFIIGVRNFYLVNPRVKSMVYSPIFGLTIEWPWRTAETNDGVLRAALYASTGSLFLYEWNPISGVGGVYGSYIWYYVRDYAWLRNPSTLEPTPVRATWNIRKEETIVPTDAIVYNPDTHSWENVAEGTTAEYVVEMNFKFSNYHDGSPMTLLDILMTYAWYAEWASKSGDDDVWYHPNVEEDYRYITDDIVGIEIINSTAIRVYGTYGLFYSLDETAVYYLDYFWPSWHPLLRLSMEYVVINNGPVSGVKYGWLTGEGDKTLDAMNPEHVADVAEAARLIGNGTYRPPYLNNTINLLVGKGISVQDISTSCNKLATFVTAKGHLVVSNGPYYIEKYIPEQMYVELKAFRDQTYPFTPDYWLRIFEVSQLKLGGAVMVPTIIVTGYQAEVEVPVIKYMIFPDEGVAPAGDVNAELVLRKVGGELIASLSGEVVDTGPPTIWRFTIPPEITRNLAGLDSVLLEVRFWRQPGLYEISESFMVEVLTLETPTETITPGTVTVYTTKTTTVTVPTTVTETPVITPAGAVIAVVMVVVGVALGYVLFRKK